MVITCRYCSKWYRVNLGRLKSNIFSFTCKKCNRINKVEIENFFPERTNHSNAEMKNYLLSSQQEKSTLTEKILPTFLDGDRLSRLATTHLKKEYGMLGITSKATAIMLLISIIPLLILWINSYRRIDNQIRGDTEQVMLESASGLSKQISLRVDQNTDILNMLSRMPDIISMDSNRQFPLLKQIQHTYPWMYLIFVIGPDGLCTTWVDRDSDSLFLDYKDKIAFNENRLTRQIFSPQMNLEPAMVFSKPIRSNDRTVGFLVTCTFFYKISSLISTWQLGQSGYAFLVDENYKVIVHKVDEFIDEERIFTDHPLIREYHSGKRKLIYFEDDNDVEYVGLVTQLDLGWFLAIQQKESETFAILTKERNTAYFALTITIISVVLITWCLGRAITIPIQKIILAADRISVGDFNVDLGKPKNDEMGDLITAIITMKNCIRESLNRLQNRRTLPRKSSPTMTAPKHKKFAEHFED